MREQTENKPEMTEPKNQTRTQQSREHDRPRHDSETDEPQICRGVD